MNDQHDNQVHHADDGARNGATRIARVPSHSLRMGSAVFVVAASILSFGACRNEQRIVVPNRVLDRPLDVTLGCVRVSETGAVETLPLDTCRTNTPTSDCTAADTPQLIGFIANSERNEVAMFRRCDVNGLVDLDTEAPGYNFVPVGQLPSKITATNRACEVVTANAGSCDLSVIDGPQLAAYAVGEAPDTAPSSLVSTVIPRLSTGEPLAARPGDVLAVPPHLSGAGVTPDDSGDGGDLDDPVDVCEAQAKSVFVTFPSCQLVAEVSLESQRILQSRQFVTAEDGSLQIVDSGTDPICPVECPAQFDETVPDRGPVAAEGMFPNALALIERVEDDELTENEPQSRLDYSALLVGGTGADALFEIAFTATNDPVEPEDSRWVPAEETPQLVLDDASGVHAIRPTPPMNIDGDIHQFLYVIAGDGSTRVVDRAFEPEGLGVECDTQVDPTLVPPSACYPIVPGAAGNEQQRRPGVRGPGIRVQGGTINDWAFYDVNENEYPEIDGSRAPFGMAGVVGVGVTSTGQVVYATFGQFLDAGSRVQSVDPLGIMNVELRPHVLWPTVDPHTGAPEALPRLDDEELRRTLPGTTDDVHWLSPSVRLIDAAYSQVPENINVSDERRGIADALGEPVNVDQLGGFDEVGIYEDTPPRVVVRDYRQWTPQGWLLDWQGLIPGAAGNTGRIECENLGWEDATCQSMPGEAEPDAALIDASAQFCDVGVLAGDMLVISGCGSDDDCGLGQRCLREPTAPSSATGICISAVAYDETFELMRHVCAPFITDPCGQRRREYHIERAYQDALWLRELDLPLTSYTREVEAEDGSLTLVEIEDRFTCELPLVAVPGADDFECTSDDECAAAFGDDERYQCRQGVCRLEATCSRDSDCPGADSVCLEGICRGACPGGFPTCTECTEDADCGGYGPGALCIDQICRRPCVAGEADCRRAELPGPRCFAELVSYAVRANDSFVVTGSATPFFADRVYADPDTQECRVDETVSNLLTSRLWLGADEFETFNDPVRGIPDCPNASEASPTDPNPCRIVTTRAQQPTSLFHLFGYRGETVSAIRFSNPMMSFVLDLTSLLELASGPDESDAEAWPLDFVPFRRSRIPRGYQESFDAAGGYVPLTVGVIVRDTAMTYPVRIIPAPEPGAAFVVDAGGRPGTRGVRGQVIRLLPSGVISGDNLADSDFLVR